MVIKNKTKMKKTILSIIIALSSIISVNAQFNIGGSVSFNTSIMKPEMGGDKEVSNSFSVSPSIGYRLNEKWEVGISLTINSFDSKQPLFSVSNEGNFVDMTVNETKAKEYFIETYVRYQLVRFNKFSIHGLFNVYAGKGESENTFFSLKENTDYTLWGANICPVLMFDLSNKFSVFANLNFLNLGFSQYKIKGRHTTTEFNFITNINDILPAIGLIYKF